MWKLENHEGIKYWYEGELIERIKELIKPVIIMNTCDNCDGVGYGEGCKDISCGVYAANKIYDLIQEYEKEKE